MVKKRLQVLIDEPGLREIKRAARQTGMTMADWVRHALRAATRRRPQTARERKLQTVREAYRHEFAAPPIEQMLAEIERGYFEDGTN